MNYIIVYPNELNHYGVKGMKWGVRHDQRYIGAKQNYRNAKKAYSEAYNKASGFSSRHPITQFIKKSKNYEKSNKLWEDAYNKAEASNKAKKNIKDTKKMIKVEKYRDRLAKRAKNQSDFYKEDAANNRSALNDLNKNGKKSEAYQNARRNYISQRKSSKEWNDQTYSAWDAVSDTVNFEANSRTTMKELRNELTTNASTSTKKAKQWATRSNTLSSTPVSSLTTKKEIRKIYKGK